MVEIPVSMICFNENKIKRLTLNKPLAVDELKYHRIRVNAEFLKDYDPEKHVFEIIRKDRE